MSNIIDVYEKMRKKPGFNEPAVINQPEPRIMGDQVVSDIDRKTSQPPVSKPSKEEEDREYNERFKRKVLEAAEAKGKKIDGVSSPPAKHASKLEKRVAYLEEAVKLLMEQQMKMLNG